MTLRLDVNALIDAADRFREWSRSEAGARTCMSVAEGSFAAENELVRAFVESINPPKADG